MYGYVFCLYGFLEVCVMGFFGVVVDGRECVGG